MDQCSVDLFGGAAGWDTSLWTASDDRVRGGSSQSYLETTRDGKVARFFGTLDTKTLGGAGFASQRTASDSTEWDLSQFDGIEVVLVRGDDKRYTFNVKDKLLPRDPNTGREQSTISYEYDFKFPATSDTDAKEYVLWIPWSSMRPFYRGREQTNAPKLNTSSIKRFDIMCRSFFDEQDGDFSLDIKRISAVKGKPDAAQQCEKAAVVEEVKRDVQSVLHQHPTTNKDGADYTRPADENRTSGDSGLSKGKIASLALLASATVLVARHCL